MATSTIISATLQTATATATATSSSGAASSNSAAGAGAAAAGGNRNARKVVQEPMIDEYSRRYRQTPNAH